MDKRLIIEVFCLTFAFWASALSSSTVQLIGSYYWLDLRIFHVVEINVYAGIFIGIVGPFSFFKNEY